MYRDQERGRVGPEAFVPRAERHVEREELVDERAVARLREDALG
jgi:hypothetical protein